MIWTGRTRCSGSAARSPDEPICGRCRRGGLCHPALHTGGTAVRLRALSLLYSACADPTARPNDLGKIVRDRLAGIGVVTGRRGTHALRHAAAQHLLDQGMSMKVIGDFLGHRDPSSTAIYAKVDLAALREVAALDLEGLA